MFNPLPLLKEVSTISNIMYIQPFSMEVDWPEIWCLMEVSTMFYICGYCFFTWWGRFNHTTHNNNFLNINWERNTVFTRIYWYVCRNRLSRPIELINLPTLWTSTPSDLKVVVQFVDVSMYLLFISAWLLHLLYTVLFCSWCEESD